MVATPAKVRDRIWQDHCWGAGARAIATALNNDRVPTARGGTIWQPATVQAQLASIRGGMLARRQRALTDPIVGPFLAGIELAVAVLCASGSGNAAAELMVLRFGPDVRAGRPGVSDARDGAHQGTAESADRPDASLWWRVGRWHALAAAGVTEDDRTLAALADDDALERAWHAAVAATCWEVVTPLDAAARAELRVRPPEAWRWMLAHPHATVAMRSGLATPNDPPAR